MSTTDLLHSPAPTGPRAGKADPSPPTRLRLTHWHSRLGDDPAFASEWFGGAEWKPVRVPHNWDDYYGYQVQSHGNLHGTAWYQTEIEWSPTGADAHAYGFFEGVGSYADVYVNGRHCGSHAGGRTTFTVNLTNALRPGRNLLAVRAHHPEGIDDLPFVCGGCWGAPNTEGTQPLGMFRPAWLECCGPVRVEPFGVHMLTPEVSAQRARVVGRVALMNPDGQARTITVRQRLKAPDGRVIAEQECERYLDDVAGNVEFAFPPIDKPELWGPGHPALYRAETSVQIDGALSHHTETTFGLRWLEWPVIREPDADHNITCGSRLGALLSNGAVERTPANNGLTDILHAIEDAPIRLAPMGVVLTQLGSSTQETANLHATIRLQVEASAGAELYCEVQNEGGTVFFHQWRQPLKLDAGGHTVEWSIPAIYHPHRWLDRDPYLHRLLVELRGTDGSLWERSETLFGIRPVNWDPAAPLNLARPVYERKEKTVIKDQPSREPAVLKLNGTAHFLNGTCEYENLLGCDHAFTDEQIAADVAMMKAAGFNAFRDAHHPHNLRYYDHWDRAGIVCWTQIGSHIWFDNERFRENHRRIIAEWVKERRNHPCIILWGLQNESSLPEDYAREMRDLIRELDPTSPAWRLTTTCNGGKGTDWNVPQEWSGTYGGNCHDYDLADRQLVGEYGVWRAIGTHTECAYHGNENDRTESWACFAIETKIALGEAARHDAVGHFHWIFNTFPNPGRTAENYEGPDNAEIGPMNNKGLVTAWHQPSDLYYLFRANYADPAADPMVYLVSHTWPDRWRVPGPRRVAVFSNCEEVELFNGVGQRSLGVRRQPGRGRHFEWDGVEPEGNILHAVGRVAGRVVAEDLIMLDHLPADDSVSEWIGEPADLALAEGTPRFRVNCGCDGTYTDPRGIIWQPDTPWTSDAACGWESWAGRFEKLPDDLASRGQSITPVRGSGLPGIYRHYRFGREQLAYHFRTGPGRFRMVCHFAEPWFGVGGAVDCRGWRLFDVAINDRVVDPRLDVWGESGGTHRALRRSYDVETTGQVLTLHFPTITVNQALLYAIECYEL